MSETDENLSPDTPEERASKLVFARGNTWWCDYDMGSNKSLVMDIATAIREAEERGAEKAIDALCQSHEEMRKRVMDLIENSAGPNEKLLAMRDRYEAVNRARAEKNERGA